MSLPASGRLLALLPAWRGVAAYSCLALLLLLSGPDHVLAQQEQGATRRDPTVPPAAWLAEQPDDDAVASPTAGYDVLPANRDPGAIEVTSFEPLSEPERRLALALEFEDVIRAS